MAATSSRLSNSENAAQRRETVARFAAPGASAPAILAEMKRDGIVNPRTGQAYSVKTIREDLKVVGPRDIKYVNGVRTFKRRFAETIGQQTWTKPLWNARILLNVDTTWKDYVFWDSLRRGMAPGYRVGGLFCMPIAQAIASHAMGEGVSAALVEGTSPTVALHEDGKPTKAMKNGTKTAAARAKSAAPSGKVSVNGANAATDPTGRAKAGTFIPSPAPRRNPGGDDEVAYTNAQLKKMMKRNQALFQQVVVDDYCFGNQYVIVNPDCTFSVASPETVSVTYSASDYHRPIKVTITTKMQSAVVVDEYTDDLRTVTIRYLDERGTQVWHYENLIGRIPVVHFANDRSANEIYGRPIYEAALPIMSAYDDLIFKTKEGVELLSNPIPVFEGLDNPTETKQLNSDAVTYLDENGVEQTQYVTRFDRNAGLYIGKGGRAQMLASPVGFTKDALDVLRQFFLLLLSHTRIPEFMWGGAIDSSKASAETQLPPFIEYIKFRRLQLEGGGADPELELKARGGFQELIELWLRMYQVMNPAIVVGPVDILWPEIDVENSLVKFNYVSFFRGTGDVTAEDAIAASGVWDDPRSVAARAAGQKAVSPKFDDYAARLNKARLAAAKADTEPGDDDGPGWSTDYYVAPDEIEDVMSPFGSLPWPHMFSGNGSG